MTDGGLDVRASISMVEDGRLQQDMGISVEYDGIFYPGRIIECANPITAESPGEAVIGIIYFTCAPVIDVGSELGLVVGATRRVGTATVLEVTH